MEIWPPKAGADRILGLLSSPGYYKETVVILQSLLSVVIGALADYQHVPWWPRLFGGMAFWRSEARASELTQPLRQGSAALLRAKERGTLGVAEACHDHGP